MWQFLLASLALALTMVAAPDGQALPSDEIVPRIAELAGAWEGTLEYLDYGDNETRVTLRMSVVYRESTGGAAYDIEFGEPDRRIVTDGGRFERLPSGKVVLGTEAYDVVRFETAGSGPGFTLVLTMRGQDAGQPAQIQQVIEHTGSGLVVRKEVRFDGNTEYFTRNEVKLSRRDQTVHPSALDRFRLYPPNRASLIGQRSVPAADYHPTIYVRRTSHIRLGRPRSTALPAAPAGSASP